MIGQIVQRVKDNLPHASQRMDRYNPSMSPRALITPAEFDQMFIARTKALREHKGLSAAAMAELLGIPAERYRKYETRSALPHDLIERFALITGVTVEFVLTGRRVKGKGPYPDVPGPHMLEEWRAKVSKTEPDPRRK